MRQNVDMTSFDTEIKTLNDRKSQLYADTIKHADAKGYSIDPANVRKEVAYETDKIDLEIKNINTAKKTRLKNTEDEAEYQYDNLKTNFIDARTKQQNAQEMLDQELMKPKSDPDMIQDLKEKKDKSDKDFDGIKKEFSKA
jgi:hypothetical protein